MANDSTYNGQLCGRWSLTLITEEEGPVMFAINDLLECIQGCCKVFAISSNDTKL